MMQLGSLDFPSYSDMHFDLAPTEENREIRIQYARLPYRLLVPGNCSKNPGRTLSIDSQDSWHRYTFAAVSRLAKKLDHPSSSTMGILFFCMLLSCHPYFLPFN
jgi:hypothetical protein